MKKWSSPRPLVVLLGIALPVCGQRVIHVPADVSTIQGGINAAQNGDTILVSPGTYNENLDFKGKNITVSSGATSVNDAAVSSTIVQAGAAAMPVVKIVSGEGRGAVLNGFTVQGARVNGRNDNASGLLIEASSPTISNNLIQNNIGCGVLIGAPTASPILTGNHIRNGNFYCRRDRAGHSAPLQWNSRADFGSLRAVADLLSAAQKHTNSMPTPSRAYLSCLPFRMHEHHLSAE